jgi:Kef-type K+ transport system membrane component KefB
MNFVAPSEHQVLVFLVQLTVLLVVARLLGQACRRVGQPAVVGELAAGVVIGPSVFGRVWPDGFDWLFPADAVQSGMLFMIGWLGVMLLLVITGFETDLALIGRLGRAAVTVSVGSLVVPFALGAVTGAVIPSAFLFVGEDRVIFSLFLATGLTISSLPVIATILSELRLLRRDFGQLTIAAGMANDVVGWVLLGLIAGLVATGEFVLGEFVTTLLGLVVFLALAAALGQRIVDRVLLALRRRSVGIGGWVTMCIAMSVGLGAVTQALGVEAVLGAFIAGLLLGRSRYTRRDVEEQIESLTSSVLAPIFFATAGLRVDIALLADGQVLTWAVILLVVATVSKFGGAWVSTPVALSGSSSRRSASISGCSTRRRT